MRRSRGTFWLRSSRIAISRFSVVTITHADLQLQWTLGRKKKRFRSSVQTVLGCVTLRYSHMLLHTCQPARPAHPAHHTLQIPKCNSYDAISHVICPPSPSLDTGTKTPKSSGPNIPKALEPATRQRRPLVCKGRVNAITAETPHSLYVAI